jgi:hypothetical protein
MIYIQGFLTLLGAYLFIANYLKQDDLFDFEGFFDKFFGVKKEEQKNDIVYYEQLETVIDKLAFNNSPWAWAVPFDYEYPRRDVFDCFENRIDASNFKSKMPCPICKTPAEELLWIKFSSPAYTWENLYGTEGQMSLCEKCYIEVDYCQTACN